MSKHIPVLLKESIEILNPQPGEFFIDGTFGGGGHAAAILEKVSPDGKLLGIDWDEKAIQSFKLQASSFKNLILVHGNYADIPEILEKLRQADPSIPLRVNGLIVDLGLSSDQLENSGRPACNALRSNEGRPACNALRSNAGRGFSFQRDEFLDMRFDQEGDRQTAAEIINSLSEKDLADIFWKYGEERNSRKIAKAIVEKRRKNRIKTTFELAGIVEEVMPRRARLQRFGRSQCGQGKIHPATKVFQALRIYVNSELENLERLLNSLSDILAEGGRVAIISFHSLEDRIAKNKFRDLAKTGEAEILTKKPLVPSIEEIKNNQRSRSAKLRAIKL